MTQSFDSSTILSIVAAILAGIAVVLLLIRILRRKSTRDSARSLAGAKTLDEDETHGERWVTIVDQLDQLERRNKDQMQVMTADMVEANDWQALGRQFDSLLDKRLEHLKTLASRHNGSFGTEEALLHTLEAYRLSVLILTLFDQFVADSDLVTELLDEWLLAHRGTTTSQLGMMVHLDCARILLLNLDYACPSLETSLEQLDLAGEYCASACSPDEDEHSPCKVLLSEIALRERRLSERSLAS